MTQEALKLALEALTYIYTETTADEDELIDKAIIAIKEALAQPEQEPVKYSDYEPDGVHHNKPAQPEQKLIGTVGDLFDDRVIAHRKLDRNLLVYTSPPKRKPLTSKEIRAIEVEVAMSNSFAHPTKAEEFVRAIEAAHGIRY